MSAHVVIPFPTSDEFAAVPAALRDERMWRTWHRAPEGNKVPCDERGANLAKWGDASHDLTFDQARAHLEALRSSMAGETFGIGVVRRAPWTFVDLDRDVEVGRFRNVGCYVEGSVTPGRFHAVGRAAYGDGEAFEVNPDGSLGPFCGFMTVTGKDGGGDPTVDVGLVLWSLRQERGAANEPKRRADVSLNPRDLPVEERIAQARAWLEKEPGGYIQGYRPDDPVQRGDDECHRVCASMRGFALSEDDAFEALPPWNARCDPPRPEHVLRQKIASSLRNAKEVEGGRLVVKGQRPTIVISTELVSVVEQAISAVQANPDLRVFVRARALFTLDRDGSSPEKWLTRPPGAPVITPLDEVRGREVLALAALWKKVVKGNLEPALPPVFAVQHFLNRSHWPFRYLEAVTETPTFLADGRVLSKPGHDEASGVLLEPPPGAEWPDVPEHPRHDEARAAVKVLLEPVQDFPFVAPSDEGAYLAAVLTLLARPAIDGPTPLFAVRAKAPATGKGLLATVIGIIGTGRPPAVTTLPDDGDEFRKRITAIAVSGTPLVLLDDLEGSISSGVFAAALTATVWEDRILGRTEMVRVPLLTTWLATGNNIAFKRTLGRRVVPIDLDANKENPEDRTDFKIPNLAEWTTANRSRLVVAGLTVLRGFHAAGRPQHGKARMGSFEAWDRLVRAAVVWAHGTDPASADDPEAARGRIRASSDDDLADIGMLLEAVRAEVGNQQWTAAQLWKWAEASPALRDALNQATPERGGRPATVASLRYKVRAWEGRPVSQGGARSATPGATLTLRKVSQGNARNAAWAVLQDGEKPGSEVPSPPVQGDVPF